MTRIKHFTGIRFEKSVALTRLIAHLRKSGREDLIEKWISKIEEIFRQKGEILDESVYGLNLTELAISLGIRDSAFSLFVFGRYDFKTRDLIQRVFIIGIDGECTGCYAQGTMRDEGDYDHQNNSILKCSLCGREQLEDKSEPFYI